MNTPTANSIGTGQDAPLMAHGSVLQTGISDGKIAMWLFLGSEVMFFTGLIGAYIVLRFGQGEWPRPEQTLNVPLTALNTFFLICLSVTLVWTLQSIQAGRRARGNALLALGQLDAAIDRYRRALLIRPDNARVHLNLGIALIRVDRMDEAIQHFREALRINPDLTAARALLDELSETRTQAPP